MWTSTISILLRLNCPRIYTYIHLPLEFYIHLKFQMEEKLQELQKKLAEEESDKKGMSTIISQMTEKQSVEKENMLEVHN